VSEKSPYEELVWLADSCLELWNNPGQMEWSWGEGVLMYGFLRAAQITGKMSYVNYVKTYIDAHVDGQGNLDVRLLYPDRVTPGIACAELLCITGDERYRRVCDRLAEWLMYQAPRAANGGWLHLTLLDWEYIDTLFMTTVFLAFYGKYLENPEYLAEALTQHNLLAENLYSTDQRLFWHGWDQDGLFCPFASPYRHHNTVFWARGNGWAVSSLIRVLALTDSSFLGYDIAIKRLEDHITRLYELQDPGSGHWWTVLDQPHSFMNYTETTATALIVEASLLGIRSGLLKSPPLEEQIEKGTAAVRERIITDLKGRARVIKSSIGTNPGGYWNYVLTPTMPDRLWGVGATLLMLAELTEKN
jgi:unsaturated rhamnogalacturonyl hydrolase